MDALKALESLVTKSASSGQHSRLRASLPSLDALDSGPWTDPHAAREPRIIPMHDDDYGELNTDEAQNESQGRGGSRSSASEGETQTSRQVTSSLQQQSVQEEAQKDFSSSASFSSFSSGMGESVDTESEGTETVVRVEDDYDNRKREMKQCLEFADLVKDSGRKGDSLVGVWRETCRGPAESPAATSTFKAMCQDLADVVAPFAKEETYSPEEICKAVMKFFWQETAPYTGKSRVAEAD
uniref:Uncharacterized protein n=1 Tax=Chromera velia CCMP2878 TaxID=1169474 RepID=A0A0G4I5I9_9ALVE|eukprot:Cvel_11192.t1-p1 / transcript=Cvel_11192.t1 / gene=Cvel_11192 / organism=Chromera_velia_CCMP2878 / gene_product=hypothetical protein / transcript_product=hypothetical protein / location=Cvel_scaffold695:43544-46170(-) / protein_length=239 / sequence_SO=supercontig / SO=protein_coding / is_pseudo=false